MGRPKGKDRYKLRPGEQYIPFLGADLTFNFPEELDYVMEAWNKGVTIIAMAKAIRHTQEEVAILIMDLALNGQIDLRPGAALGTREAI